MTLVHPNHFPDHAPPAARRRPSGGGLGPSGIALASVGATLVALGLRRGGGLGWLVGLGGAALALGAVSRHGLIARWIDQTPYEEEEARRLGWKSAAAVTRSITIQKSRQELYRFWRHLPNLSRVMEPVEEIRNLDEAGTRTRWAVKGPAGRRVTWTAIITEDEADRRIAWESMPSAKVRNSGWVEFRDAPNGLGTEVSATILYEPPGGKIGRALAKLTGREPGVEARDALRQLKQVMEVGAIATSRVR